MRVRSVTVALVVLAVVAAHAAHGGTSAAPRWIVFSGSPGGTPPAQLYRIQTTGTELEQITKGANAAHAPSFSPDGKRIVFARLGAGIFVVNLDGSGLRRLTGAGHDNFPVWSPDGKQIAFRRLARNDWRLYLMDANGRHVRPLPLAPPAARPTWSADRKSIFYPGEGEVVQVDARTGRLLERFVVSRISATSQAAAVSPNGRAVAFVTDRPPPGCDNETCVGFGLYLGQMRGGSQRLLAIGTGPPGWSPDGTTLVFAHRGALYLWPLAGTNRTPLATGDIVIEGGAPPAWQPR
jgi:Tol biopolymer transport system component